MIAEKKTELALGTKVIEVDNNISLSTASIVDIDTPIAKMKEYIGGSKWEGITYYKQIKGEDDVNNPIDVFSNNVAQQYDKITDYVLKVTTPISPTGESLEGEAVVLHFRPQVNDVFKAPLITGDVGLFQVMTTKINNFNNRDAVEISFKIIARGKNDLRAFTSLEERIVSVLHFDRDSNYLNSSPLLLDKEWSFSKWLKKKDVILKKYYLSKFMDNHTGMLITDNYTSISVTKLFIKLCDATDIDIINITFPPTLDKAIDPILNAILNRDTSLLYIKPDCFNNHPNPIYNTLVYEGLNLKGTALFGDNFKNGNPKSDIEILIYNYINNASIDEVMLKSVVEGINDFDTSIIYMIVPILILIIQDTLHKNSSDLRRV